MREDADQFACGVAGEPRVRIERQAIAHRWKKLECADLHVEARVFRSTQQVVELFDLAALALPAHPDLIVRVPQAFAMEEEETALAAVREALVQRRDSGCRGLEDGGVVGHLALPRVLEVAEDGEMQPRIAVGQGRHFEALEQFFDLEHRGQQHRHDDHRSRVRRQ